MEKSKTHHFLIFIICFVMMTMSGEGGMKGKVIAQAQGHYPRDKCASYSTQPMNSMFIWKMQSDNKGYVVTTQAGKEACFTGRHWDTEFGKLGKGQLWRSLIEGKQVLARPGKACEAGVQLIDPKDVICGNGVALVGGDTKCEVQETIIIGDGNTSETEDRSNMEESWFQRWRVFEWLPWLVIVVGMWAILRILWQAKILQKCRPCWTRTTPTGAQLNTFILQDCNDQTTVIEWLMRMKNEHAWARVCKLGVDGFRGNTIDVDLNQSWEGVVDWLDLNGIPKGEYSPTVDYVELDLHEPGTHECQLLAVPELPAPNQQQKKKKKFKEMAPPGFSEMVQEVIEMKELTDGVPTQTSASGGVYESHPISGAKGKKLNK
ncbi:structural protein [Common carp toti-like virus 1]|uniref:Structural protein n=1 Tax=Common carp toti-like virus 1 TaxID=2855314 RepID=A0A8F5GJH5_9VIRU|nr:structural protein [Common carp toti-like virus 1]